MARTVNGRLQGQAARKDPPHADLEYPPDSKYWSGHAQATATVLFGRVGKDTFSRIVDAVWPGETIQNHTWQTICLTYEAGVSASRLGKSEAEIIKAMEDTCKP